MGKILVKASPQTMMDSKGNVQFLYGGGEKGGDKGSMLARVLGGAGKVAGGALGAAGPHRSLMGLLGGIQSGAATGQQAGRWAGGISDLAPGGRTRAARRGIREKEKEKYADLRAREIESGDKRFTRGSVGIRPSKRRAERRGRLGLENTRAQREKEQEEERRQIRRLKTGKEWRDANKPKTGNEAEELAAKVSGGIGGVGVRGANVIDTGQLVAGTAGAMRLTGVQPLHHETAAELKDDPPLNPDGTSPTRINELNNQVAPGPPVQQPIQNIVSPTSMPTGLNPEEVRAILAANAANAGANAGSKLSDEVPV